MKMTVRVSTKRKEYGSACCYQAATAGELNFLITYVCLDYLEQHGKNYQTINDIIGALECAKQEFYRRLVAPYEDTKIKDNGDVYDTRGPEYSPVSEKDDQP